jgi:hypothetical protein
MATKLASIPIDATLQPQLSVLCDEEFWEYKFSIAAENAGMSFQYLISTFLVYFFRDLLKWW